MTDQRIINIVIVAILVFLLVRVMILEHRNKR